MTPRECLQQLVGGVQQDLTDYDSLHQILNEQYQLLRERDSQGLADLLKREQTLLLPLRERAARRSKLLAQLGLDASDHGMRQLLDKLPANLSEKLSPQWQQLQQRVVECKRQNEQNGKLLAIQNQVIRRMLYGEPSGDYSPANPGYNSPY